MCIRGLKGLRGDSRGFPPATMNVALSYFPCLLVVFTQQLEILVASPIPVHHKIIESITKQIFFATLTYFNLV